MRFASGWYAESDWNWIFESEDFISNTGTKNRCQDFKINQVYNFTENAYSVYLFPDRSTSVIK